MRTNNIIITIDYETWQPLPEGYHIDWRKDILENTEKLMSVCEASGARLTLMVEMCELLWLEENETQIYEEICAQLQNAIKRGHDAQLHMHPNWMPELGAKRSGDSYIWDMRFAACEDYPGDLDELVGRCKDRLEKILRVVKPDYRVTAFRAGGYMAQPFGRLYRALQNNGILIDTSVYAGGISEERGYDYSKCRSFSHPYFVDPADPQLSGSGSICELPVSVYKNGRRMMIDYNESKCCAYRFFEAQMQQYQHARNWFCLIGHSKTPHDFDALRDQLSFLSQWPGTEFTTIFDACEDIVADARESTKADLTNGEVQELLDHFPPCEVSGAAISREWENAVRLRNSTRRDQYTWIAALILRQYGYKARWIKVCEKGDKAHKDLIELRLDGKRYWICPLCRRILTPEDAQENLCACGDAPCRQSPARYYSISGIPIPNNFMSRKRMLVNDIRNLICCDLPRMFRFRISIRQKRAKSHL